MTDSIFFILRSVLLFMLIVAIKDGFAFNPRANIWISPDELAALPMEGQPWERLKAQALKPASTPNLSDQNQNNNVYVLAKALVYARCSLTPVHDSCSTFPFAHLRIEVIEQIMAAIGTEQGGRTLAIGRELVAYIIAADLVGSG